MQEDLRVDMRKLQTEIKQHTGRSPKVKATKDWISELKDELHKTSIQ